MIQITCRDGHLGCEFRDSDDLEQSYRPIGDSLPVLTWRKDKQGDVVMRRYYYKYPKRGCHGGPLERPDLEDRTDIP